MRVLTFPASGDHRDVAQTVAAMHALAQGGARDARVRDLAARIVAGVARRDYRGEAAALLAWVQQNVRYVRDPLTTDGVERVQHPVRTLEVPHGDCDDLSALLAALAASVGFAYAFRTVGDNEADRDDLRHVYVMLLVPGDGWVAADPSFEEALGWEPSAAAPSVLRDGTVLARVESVRDWPAG